MNTRREFFQNSLLSFGILPLLNKFNFSNNDSFLIQNSWGKFLPPAYYLKNGFSKSERIIGSNNYGSSEWGIRVYKEKINER